MENSGTVQPSDIKDVNWLTDPHNNSLSRFRQFKRSKQGKRLPEE